MNLPKLIELAQKASKTATHETFKIGAVVFRQGKVISIGSNNKYKTHPLLRKFDEHKTLHAECDALLSKRYATCFKNASILVYRETKDGSFANSKPCHMCEKVIKLYGLKKVYYTTETGINSYKVKDLK